MTELIFGHTGSFEPIDFVVMLGEEEPLRPAVMVIAEPYLRRWMEQANVPYDAFRPPLAVGEDDDLTELSQGFVVGVDGRVRVTYSLADEPFGDLVRAFDNELIAADPHDIRVLLRVPSAGLGGAGWDSFEAAVELFIHWSLKIGEAYVAFAGLSTLVAKFRHALDVLLRHKHELEVHGFAPPDAVRLAAVKRWTLAELAEALGTTTEEAAELLEGFGFVRDESGVWRSPPDLSKELAMVFLWALTGYDAIKRNEAALTERLRSELDAWVERSRQLE